MTAIGSAAVAGITCEQCFIVYFHSPKSRRLRRTYKLSFAIGHSTTSRNAIIDRYFQTPYKVLVIEEQNIGISCLNCFHYNAVATDREDAKHVGVGYYNFRKGSTEAHLPFRVGRKQDLFSWYVVTRLLCVVVPLCFTEASRRRGDNCGSACACFASLGAVTTLKDEPSLAVGACFASLGAVTTLKDESA